MNKERKARIGARCHNAGRCDKCPYYAGRDMMLDPRIDPDYESHILERSKKCRDELIADLAIITGEWPGEIPPKEGRSRSADDTIPRFDDSIGRMPEL